MEGKIENEILITLIIAVAAVICVFYISSCNRDSYDRDRAEIQLKMMQAKKEQSK